MKTKNSTFILILSTAAMMMSFTVWSVFAPIATEIQRLYQLSALEKSILIAAPILLGSIMRIPMGILTDRYGGRRLYTLTMLFLALPLIGAGFAASYSMLLLAAFFIGMAGTTFAISIAYVSRWFPAEKQGLVLGIAGMGNLGSAAANFLIPIIFTFYGLGWVFWSLALSIGIMAVLFWFGTQDEKQPNEVKRLKDSLSVLKFQETWILSLFYFLTFGGFVTFSMYLPTLLVDLFTMTAVKAGMVTAGFVVAATFVRPVGGYLSDRFGARKVLTVVFCGVFLFGLCISFTLDSFASFSVICMMAALVLGVGNGAVFKMVPEVSPENIGSVTGIVGAFGGVGGFFPPILIGFTKDITGDYFLSFALLALLSLVCLLLHQIMNSRTNAHVRTINHS
ncbi:MFS transporter [Bacillus thermotolerans]|uniref:MFS transporter n=1 Tax=Bacillus thermotolerans TaxID=1221996 RepID=UPI00057E299C|nr:Nitrate/nitrite transporter [Bacillus thermotolerans]